MQSLWKDFRRRLPIDFPLFRRRSVKKQATRHVTSLVVVQPQPSLVRELNCRRPKTVARCGVANAKSTRASLIASRVIGFRNCELQIGLNCRFVLNSNFVRTSSSSSPNHGQPRDVTRQERGTELRKLRSFCERRDAQRTPFPFHSLSSPFTLSAFPPSLR